MHTFISFAFLDLFGRVLYLKKEFHSFNGRHSSLGYGSGHTAGDEILTERNRIEWHLMG